MKIKRSIDVIVELTVNEVADAFCEMDGGQQAEFFNRIDEAFAAFGGSLPMQMQAVTDSNALTGSGRYVMSKIGEYSAP